MAMGTYGIGVTRVVAAAIEQNHDARGIIWPEPLAPFDLSLIPMNMQKSPRVQEVTERLYAELTAAGFDAVLDDRDARPGVKFADDELLGIPHRIVIGDKGLDRGVLEYKAGATRGRRRWSLIAPAESGAPAWDLRRGSWRHLVAVARTAHAACRPPDGPGAQRHRGGHRGRLFRDVRSAVWFAHGVRLARYVKTRGRRQICTTSTARRAGSTCRRNSCSR
jgi:hypothetical protein